MTKFFGGIVVGVFLGALTLEVLGRTHPELLEKVERRARRAAERVGDLVGAQRRAAAFERSHRDPTEDQGY